MKEFIEALTALAVFAGAAALIAFGLWLIFKPLTYIFCGVVLFFVGGILFGGDDKNSARKDEGE